MSSNEPYPYLKVCCPIGSLCPPTCDRTQQGCEHIWGPDADWAEAKRRNLMGEY